MLSCFRGRFSVTSPRGERTIGGVKEYHKGIDLVGKDDTAVYAIADGTVYTLFEKNGFGKYVRELLPDGRRIYYGHLASFAVENGVRVARGDKLGTMGSTGRAFGAHTHLEIRPAGYSSESEDISEFTDIPNRIGNYAAPEPSSDDYTVQAMIDDGVTTPENAVQWERVLSGAIPAVPDFLRTVFSRYHQKIKKE